MAKRDADLDLLFQALSDPTRRAVLDRLAQGPASVGELAAPHDMALPSFTKHIGVLEAAGLIRTVKKGRVRTCHLVPKRYQPVDDWLSRHRKLWERRTDRLGSLAQSLYRKD
ncbi:transcriptional regulator, ArsR family protein [Pseudooceanicola batsensis HTCC2597]|uniref:Transcriptional regulator, ArsR family protein n=1 Tax=Pseudooceanicola batsensis (strain ATCC BAA-863 / DSM 15984 / KCTC 12145 / HTCC2597) TaxID=252305 RepID=A3TX01_PSEBH|nr:metalloregulator ArsR/SmtB family transcription factor [Pseudooceanicola batsensis]EAQ03361.1 transcriptional regulator, ArsR family protein [Pseudooceanicola batsensis HTCC2597]